MLAQHLIPADYLAAYRRNPLDPVNCGNSEMCASSTAVRTLSERQNAVSCAVADRAPTDCVV